MGDIIIHSKPWLYSLKYLYIGWLQNCLFWFINSKYVDGWRDCLHVQAISFLLSGRISSREDNETEIVFMRRYWLDSRNSWVHIIRLKITGAKTRGWSRGHELTSSMEIPKSQLTADQPLMHAGSYQQDTLHPQDGGRGQLWWSSTPYMLGGQPTNQKLIISQKFSHRSKKVLSPTSGSPAWASGNRGRPQRIWLWRPV